MVERLIDDGWELDAHTISHLDLTTLSGARLRREVAGSRRILQQRFHQPVNFFCYPAGKFDATDDPGGPAGRLPRRDDRAARGRLSRARCSSSTASAWTARTASAACERSSGRPARSYFRFFLHFFLAAWRCRTRTGAARLRFLHFFFFVGAAGGLEVRRVAGRCTPPPGPQGASVGATEFGRGFGVVDAKSAAAVVRVVARLEQLWGSLAAIDRRSAIPEHQRGCGGAGSATRPVVRQSASSPR